MITEEVNQAMTYKPYFPYYRNAFRQNLTHKADKMEDVKKDNQKAAAQEETIGKAGESVLEKPAVTEKAGSVEKVEITGESKSGETAGHGSENKKAVVEGQGEKENQLVEINEKTSVFEHNDFNQVSPGLFQFKKSHQAAVAAVHPSNSRPEPGKQTPQLKDYEKTKNSEVGFVRLDTLPGVYSKYSTPVYQFT